MYKEIINELEKLSEASFAEWLKPYLNIDKDSNEILLGIRVPILRKLAKKYKNLSENDLLQLLQSKYHESRELALFIMLIQVSQNPQKICKMYLNNLDYINNWDLIDYTAPHIVAPNVSKNELRKLANSEYLWANRVAMVSTIHYIKQNDYDLTLELADKFISHPHHLMHKATGWMLREIGKRDKATLLNFLEKYSKAMPSIMRSYAKECLK